MHDHLGKEGGDNGVSLLEVARKAIPNAYAPYSGIQVGAALLLDDGSVISGVNVENASYGLTICAERNAVAAAVAAGHRQIRAVAITSNQEAPIPPCGACRQVLSEFARPETPIILDRGEGQPPVVYKLAELLPFPYSQ